MEKDASSSFQTHCSSLGVAFSIVFPVCCGGFILFCGVHVEGGDFSRTRTDYKEAKNQYLVHLKHVKRAIYSFRSTSLVFV